LRNEIGERSIYQLRNILEIYRLFVSSTCVDLDRHKHFTPAVKPFASHACIKENDRHIAAGTEVGICAVPFVTGWATIALISQLLQSPL
jgi:hypothetical protein